jgi:hypothetical protein
LFRTFNNVDYEAKYPLVGDRYGDFHSTKYWLSEETKIFEMSQGRGTVLRLKVREFEPPDEPVTDSKGVGGKGRKLFAIPWALTDPDSGIRSILEFINASCKPYVEQIIHKDDELAFDVFQMALNKVQGPRPVSAFLPD